MDKKKVMRVATLVCGAATVVFATLGGVSGDEVQSFVAAGFGVAAIIVGILNK